MLDEVLAVDAVTPRLADTRVVGGDLVEQCGPGHGAPGRRLRGPAAPDQITEAIRNLLLC
ncbi:hypothetical protein [Streptomyces sp. KL115B]|uniref:hypothetical protein n=1 Tax=Streptomyces sp. KL115B TaxID=3045154 RepID=UPI0024A8A6D1|nr:MULTISPECIES: hypothetical protein [unclassified Streptomyces]